MSRLKRGGSAAATPLAPKIAKRRTPLPTANDTANVSAKAREASFEGLRRMVTLPGEPLVGTLVSGRLLLDTPQPGGLASWSAGA